MRIIFRQIRLWAHGLPCGRSIRRMAKADAYHRIFAGGTGSDRGVLVLNIDQSYMNELLDSLNGGWHTASCVSDASGNVLFSNSEYRARFAQNGTTPDELETAGLDADELTRLDVTIQKEKYVCLMQPLSVYGWRMIFLSPVESLYQAPNRVFQIMLLMLAVTMLFGVWFTYQLARQNSRDINNVIRSIQRAKQGKTVERSKGEQEDYSVMLQNVVDTFLEKEYLSVQLAERRHHAKLLELQALQMQLNPHFLYNTLDAINWRAKAIGEPEISQIADSLGHFLRMTLNKKERFTLKQELDIIHYYMTIQQLRFDNRLNFTEAFRMLVWMHRFPSFPFSRCWKMPYTMRWSRSRMNVSSISPVCIPRG